MDLQQNKKVIGMIVPTVDNSFFASLACHVESYLSDRQCELLLCNSANSAEKEKEYFQTLVDKGAEGIICVSGLSVLPSDLLPENYPLLWVDRRPSSELDIPWVANDDAAAMEKATDYLLEKGCHNVLLLPGFLAERQQSPRVIGYQKSLEKHGVAFREEYILCRKGVTSTEAETEEMVQSILKQGFQIDGIIASSDRSAFGAMAALRRVGLYVPEDVKLISFDNSPYSTMATPAVTALDRNSNVLAEKACDILLQILDGQQDISMETVVPVSLVERDSTR